VIRSLLADLRHALRLYRATPAASLIAVVVLAIGMAFVAAFVSLYVDLILRPHPGFERGPGIVNYGFNTGQGAGGLPYPLIELIQKDIVSLEVAAGIGGSTFLIGDEQEQAYAEIVTTQFFDGMKPRMALGRGLDLADHAVDAEPVIVISHELWQSRFDGRDDVLGLTLRIDAPRGGFRVVNGQVIQSSDNDEQEPVDFRIVGVMSPRISESLAGPSQGVAAFWMAVERAVPILLGSDASVSEYTNVMRGVARRARGANTEVIRRELEAKFADDLATLLPVTGARFDVINGWVYNVFTQRSVKRQLELFLGASILLALVAAANVSLFLLARAPGRRRELAIRMSVGAPMRRLARQLASEATLLVVAGGVLGILLSIWLAEYLRNLEIMRNAQFRTVTLLDWRVLALVGGILLLLSLFVSLAPILGLKRLGIAASSRQVPARATAAQWIAGTVQITIAGTLAGAAVAFAWYIGGMVFGDPGFRTRDLYVAQMTSTFVTPDGRVATTSSSAVDNARRRETLLSIPGVTRVAFSSGIPGSQVGMIGFTVPHPEDANRSVQIRMMSIDEYFVDLMGFRLVDGRPPESTEAGAVMVNQMFARNLLGREDVAGEPLPVSMPVFRLPAAEQGASGIVGVLEDLSWGHPDEDVQPMVLMTGDFFSSATFAVIETVLSRKNLESALQGLIDSGALEVELSRVESVNSVRQDVIAQDRARGLLTIGEAVLVVLLAGAGFYGTQRYLVAAGRREYAIRASLGAGPRALGRLVFRRGLLLGLPGLVLSLPLAFILVSWLDKQDYIRDEYSVVTVSAIVLVVAVGLLNLMAIASVGPSMQARRTQPAPLLREE